jgi:hypothetical protein
VGLYCHLSCEERDQIAALLVAGHNNTSIPNGIPESLLLTPTADIELEKFHLRICISSRQAKETAAKVDVTLQESLLWQLQLILHHKEPGQINGNSLWRPCFTCCLSLRLHAGAHHVAGRG